MKEANIFPGVAIGKEYEHGKSPGTITLSYQSLRFESGDITLEFPLINLIIKHGGSSNQLVFFEHPDFPGKQFYTQQKKILKELKLVRSPQVTSQVDSIHGHALKMRLIILAVFLVIGLGIVGLFYARKPLTKVIVKNIPPQWEQSLGEAVFNEYKAGLLILDHQKLNEHLEAMAAPLLSGIPDRRYDFHIYIIRDPEINAFALPGGYVVLNTGLISAAQSPEEILGVLAHEISHVTQQHGIRKKVDELGIVLVINALLGDAGGLWAKIMESSAFLLNQQFSREFEREADKTGFAYLVSSDINPAGMVSFFNRLNEETKDEDSLGLNKALNFLSTHPAPEERMKYLQKKVDSLSGKDDFIALDREFTDFKNELKQVMDSL